MKTTNEQKTDVRFYRNLAIVAVAAGIIAIVGAQLCGCDSEPAPEPDPGIDATVTQPSNDSGTTNTTDTGTTNTADAKTNTPDAQQNTDPCASYVPYAGQTWTCTLNGGIPEATTVTLEEYNGTCAVGLMEGCQNPPLDQLSAGDLTCTTYASHTMRCRRD